MPDFVPRRDAELIPWSGHFCAAISQFAPELNIPPAQVAELVARQEVFRAACFRAYSPAGSSVDTRAKNDARKSLLRILRPLAGMARSGATNLQRVHMGIKPRRIGKAPPLPRPDTAPVVNIISVAGCRLNLNIKDVTGRAKAHGVHCALVHSFIGEQPPADTRQWRMARMATRRGCVLEFPSHLPPGTRVWVMAQWLSRGKLAGPTSPPIFQYLGYGEATIGTLKRAA